MFYNVRYATIAEAFLYALGKKEQSIIMTCRLIHSNVQILQSSPEATYSASNPLLTDRAMWTPEHFRGVGAAWSSLSLLSRTPSELLVHKASSLPLDTPSLCPLPRQVPCFPIEGRLAH